MLYGAGLHNAAPAFFCYSKQVSTMEERKEKYIAHISENGAIQTCNEHSIGVAKEASAMLTDTGLRNTGYLTGLLHDAGKYSDEFNDYIKKAASGEPVIKGSIIHAFAGENALLKSHHHKYGESDAFSWEEITSELLATAIGSHHGLFDEFSADGLSAFDRRMEKQPAFDESAISEFYNNCCAESDVESYFKEAVKEIQAACEKCLDISESDDETQFYIGQLQRLITSAVIDADRKDTARFMLADKDAFPDCSNSHSPLWESALVNTKKTVASFKAVTDINKARSELSDLCEQFAERPPGIYRLNLPTGGSKTLSGLRYALNHALLYNKRRIFFVIPLLSIIDQNAEVIRNAVGNDDIILEHHSDVVRESNNSEEYSRQDALFETWDAPIIITTLVQLLSTMFDSKTSCVRRFHSFCNSVIVFDEIQSLPDNMTTLFNLTVNFLSHVCNATVILCSATQPAFENARHRMRISEEQFIPNDVTQRLAPLFKRNTAGYGGDLGPDEIAAIAKDYMEDYGSALVVCNTKREASTICKILSVDTDCYHLSTDMCKAHRKAVLQELNNKLAKKENVICVSTQLIEAGVDISFGSAIRIAAGMDSIAQTAGRCNRNAEGDSSAPVTVVSYTGEDLRMLKDIKRAQITTYELISEFSKSPEEFNSDLLSDTAIDFYYRRYMKRCSEIIGLQDFKTEKGGSLYEMLSENRLFAQEDCSQSLRQAFKTAGEEFHVFDNEQTSVIVPYGKGKDVIAELLSVKCKNSLAATKKALTTAKDFTVSVYQNQLEKLIKIGAVYSDESDTMLFLRPEYYDNTTGIITNKEDVKCDTLIL